MVEAGEMELPELTSEQRLRLSSYWWSRAEGEMTSWVGFGHVLEDLVAEGSPAAVIEHAQRAVADEYAHAVFCRDSAARFGYAAPALPEPRSIKRRAFSGATEAESRLLRIAMCCLAETV